MVSRSTVRLLLEVDGGRLLDRQEISEEMFSKPELKGLRTTKVPSLPPFPGSSISQNLKEVTNSPNPGDGVQKCLLGGWFPFSPLR